MICITAAHIRRSFRMFKYSIKTVSQVNCHPNSSHIVAIKLNINIDSQLPQLQPCMLNHCQLYKQLEFMYNLLFTASSNSKWVVYILDDGIGHNLGLTGLCIATFSNTKSTFNVYGFYNGKYLCILTWHRAEIKLSGCVNSLVFLEASGTCHGGPGLLWMQLPVSQSMTLEGQLNQ